jgi:uncharacterized membrane protein YeaQ/YmgE (transglycosylase-associated protein family)
MNFLLLLVSGIIAGWLIGLIIGGPGHSLAGDFMIGALGALIAGWVFSLLNYPTNYYLDGAIAIVGGMILVALVRFFLGRV